MVHDWSTTSEEKGFSTIPTLGIPIFDRGWKWSQKNPEYVQLYSPPGVVSYAVRGSKGKYGLDLYLQVHQNPSLLQNFADYQTWLNEWHLVDNSNGFFSCTCYEGLKKYRCQHSVGLEILVQGLPVPAEVTSLPIGQRRTKGRPKKIGPALSKE